MIGLQTRRSNSIFSPLGDFLQTPFFSNQFVPHLSIEEQNQHLMINLDVPGLSENELNIDLDQSGILTISGKREETTEKSGYSERSYGFFQRSVKLPPKTTSADIEAHLERGVLSILVRKSLEDKEESRSIPINASKDTKQIEQTT